MNQTCSRHLSRLLFALLISGLVTGAAWAQASKPPAKSPAPAATPAPAASKPASPTVATPESPDKVVLKVGDQQFTKADIDDLIAHLDARTQQALAAQGKKQLGDHYALMVVLSKQAELHHLDQTPEFARMLALQKRQLEAQAEMNERSKLTPEEVQQYYTAHAADYDEIMLRQFVVRKKAAEPKPDPAHPAAPASLGLAPEEAKARAEAIRKEVVAGTEINKVMQDFKSPGNVLIEADARPFHHGAMPADMEKMAFALKDGEVSEPIDLPQAVVFVQVTSHTHADLKTATPEIESKLRPQKVEAAMTEIKKGTVVWMDEQYFAAPAAATEAPTPSAPVVKAPPKP